MTRSVDGPRAQRAFLLKAVFDGAWSITSRTALRSAWW